MFHQKSLAWHLKVFLLGWVIVLQWKLQANSDDETVIWHSVSSLKLYHPVSLPPQLSASAPSSCSGPSPPGTTRSGSRWSCGWAPASPGCRHCASRPLSGAENDETREKTLRGHVSLKSISEQLKYSISDVRSYLSWCKGFQSLDGDLVVGANFVVVGWVAKGEGKQALLLQVCFWDMENKLFSSDENQPD